MAEGEYQGASFNWQYPYGPYSPVPSYPQYLPQSSVFQIQQPVNLRVKALELALLDPAYGNEAAVERAKKFYEFLTDTDAGDKNTPEV